MSSLFGALSGSQTRRRRAYTLKTFRRRTCALRIRFHDDREEVMQAKYKLHSPLRQASYMEPAPSKLCTLGASRRPMCGDDQRQGRGGLFLEEAQKQIALHGGQYVAGGFNKTTAFTGTATNAWSSSSWRTSTRSRPGRMAVVMSYRKGPAPNTPTSNKRSPSKAQRWSSWSERPEISLRSLFFQMSARPSA